MLEAGGYAIAQTTVVTTCVILMTWLGLVGRPGRATMLWTLGFFFTLLGVYASYAGAALGIETAVLPVGQAFGCGMPLLLWSGLRALHRKRPYAWAGPAQALLTFFALTATAQLPINPFVFRAAFFATGIAVVAVAVEAMRGETRGSLYTPPLVAASLLVFALAAVGFFLPLITGDTLIELGDFLFTRISVMSSTIFLITATVTLLFYANRRPGAQDILEALDAFMPEPLMRGVARERLVRAARRNETDWTYIELCLDDLDDLRDASNAWSFRALLSTFGTIITEELRAEADLCRVAPGRVQILVAESAASTRERVRNVINRLSTEVSGIANVRVSASAGIVPVIVGKDTYDDLTKLAHDAVLEAQRLGGDRWVRLPARDSEPTTATAPTAIQPSATAQ
ncbi:hypothetical protein [Microbacterium sp. NPDC076911]|uniref:hypothetical protein n=1 Tax=Microbacterium sp. NPDC076911 TaxID=3154958 RepID=UPI0034374869